MENDLIRRAVAGEEAAISALFDEFWGQVYIYHFTAVRNQQLAEDLAAETIVRALRGLPNYRGDHSTFKSWLYTIARNVLIDHLRRHNRQRETSLTDLPEQVIQGLSDPDAETALERVEDTGDPWRVKLRQAWGQLPKSHQEVLHLRYAKGMTPILIALALGLTVGAVKARRIRALRRLRREMGIPPPPKNT